MNDEELIAHISAHSCQLAPDPTGESAILLKSSGIRALVFDIYGTLVISGSGDISLIQSEDRSPSLCSAISTAGFTILEENTAWSSLFMETLESFRARRSAENIQYPEVRIEEVWQAFIETAAGKNWLSGEGDLQLAIVDYECRVNPCWPMPHLGSVLQTLKERNLQLGIVSNAQFYTPLLFPAFLEKPLSALGFKDAFSIWSYKEREGKPSTNLYHKLKVAMENEGIAANEVLYVGNDLRNDIWPAQNLGFQTALFAGDKRSLRWRRDDPRCSNVRPDSVITDLRQILEL